MFKNDDDIYDINDNTKVNIADEYTEDYRLSRHTQIQPKLLLISGYVVWWIH